MKTSTIIAICVAIVIVTVVLASATVLYVLTNQKQSTSTTTPQPTISPTPQPSTIPTPSPSPSPSPSPEPTRRITISHSMVRKQSIVSESYGSYVIQPDSGKVFLEVNMTINNNGYDSFSTNPFDFYAVADNVKYDYYIAGNWDMVDILDGGTFKGTLVFQIPESTSSFTLGYDGYVDFLTKYNIVWTETQ